METSKKCCGVKNRGLIGVEIDTEIVNKKS
jgi:hypothetical protein